MIRRRGEGALRELAIVLGIVAMTAVFAGVDPDAGVRTWWRLRGDSAAAEVRIRDLQTRIDQHRAEARALKEDPLAQERAIRHDLGFARPGETIVRLRGHAENIADR
jgi:cell division protein FtsB